MIHHTVARAVALAALAVPAVLALGATPVSAHPATVQLAVDYQTRVTAVPAGVDVRFVADGSRLELRNHSGRVVEVLGYQGEPWIQLRADGVWVNTRAPAQYLDLPASPEKAAADPSAAAQWQRTSGASYARWHDHRVVWHGAAPPPVEADPTRAHRIRDWTVPLRVGDDTVQLAGTLDWLPPPSPGAWWAVVLIAAAAIAWLGLRSRRVLTGVALLTGLTSVVTAVALVATNVTPTAGSWAAGLGSETIPILTGLAMCAAAFARRTAADFGFAFTGIAVAIFSGVVNAPVFSHAVGPVPVDGFWSRLAVAVLVAGGIGLAVAGAVRMFRGATEPARQSTA